MLVGNKKKQKRLQCLRQTFCLCFVDPSTPSSSLCGSIISHDFCNGHNCNGCNSCVKQDKIHLFSALFMQLTCMIYLMWTQDSVSCTQGNTSLRRTQDLSRLWRRLCFLLVKETLYFWLWESTERMNEMGLLGQSADPGPAASAPVWYELSEDYSCSEPQAFRDQACCVLTLIELPDKSSWAEATLTLVQQKYACSGFWPLACYITAPKTKHLGGTTLVDFGHYVTQSNLPCCCFR